MKETVRILAWAVANGKMSAADAAERMKGLVTVREEATTIEEKRERYNEAGYEEDQNSFVHVTALNFAGLLSDRDYNTISRALREG